MTESVNPDVANWSQLHSPAWIWMRAEGLFLRGRRHPDPHDDPRVGVVLRYRHALAAPPDDPDAASVLRELSDLAEAHQICTLDEETRDELEARILAPSASTSLPPAPA